jgi:hypothetical protein
MIEVPPSDGVQLRLEPEFYRHTSLKKSKFAGCRLCPANSLDDDGQARLLTELLRESLHQIRSSSESGTQ